LIEDACDGIVWIAELPKYEIRLEMDSSAVRFISCDSVCLQYPLLIRHLFK